LCVSASRAGYSSLSAVSVADVRGPLLAAGVYGGRLGRSVDDSYGCSSGGVDPGRPSGPAPAESVVVGRTAAAWRALAACRLEWCQLQIAARCCCCCCCYYGGGGNGTIDGVATVSYNDRCLRLRASVDPATCMAIASSRSLSICVHPANAVLLDKTLRFLHATLSRNDQFQ